MNIKKNIKRKIEKFQSGGGNGKIPSKPTVPIRKDSLEKKHQPLNKPRPFVPVPDKSKEQQVQVQEQQHYIQQQQKHAMKSQLQHEVLSGVIKANQFDLTIFNEPYKKKEVVDHDVTIITGSYNRYEYVIDQIRQFFEQETKYTFRYIVLNDGSPDERYDTITQQYPTVTYIKNETPNGKRGYWKTVTRLFTEASKHNSHAVLQIDDDFYLGLNFLDRVMDTFFAEKAKNNRTVCIAYHLCGPDQQTETRWNCHNGSWVDGGGLYDYEFLNTIKFRIDEIPDSRWRKNPAISTGVWRQVSHKIRDMGCFVHKCVKSLVRHEGLTWGALERMDKGSDNKSETFFFIDDEK